MHLGLNKGPCVPHNLIPGQYSPVPVPKLQMTPTLRLFISSGYKKKDLRYLCVGEARQLHTHIERGLRFLPLLQTSYIRDYWFSPIQWRSSQGILSGRKANYNTGLCPVKGQKFGLCSRGPKSIFEPISEYNHDSAKKKTQISLIFFSEKFPTNKSQRRETSGSHNDAAKGTVLLRCYAMSFESRRSEESRHHHLHL